MKCSCSHQAQDEYHGKGNRVHNACKSKARCTVCKNEKQISVEVIKTKKNE